MRSETLLIVSVLTSVLTSAVLWWWLKNALRGLLSQLCEHGGDTDFWARYTMLMLVIAPLGVVVWFVPDNPAGATQSIRHLLLSLLFSHGFAFALVGRTLFNAVQAAIRVRPVLLASK